MRVLSFIYSDSEFKAASKNYLQAIRKTVELETFNNVVQIKPVFDNAPFRKSRDSQLIIFDENIGLWSTAKD